ENYSANLESIIKMVRKDARTYSSSVQYQRLSHDDSGFCAEQFKESRKQKRIPWKAIGYAIVLFTLGTILLVIGSLLVSGFFHEKYEDRTWPLILIGLLMFIPGAYHSYIAYYAFKGYEGFSFDDIPSFSDD
ncbi:unnamed protein product, partial [Meganyctiphanes norvegica]